MSKDLPILYSFRRCPYAMRARLAIRSAQYQCEIREVVLKDKPPSLIEASAKGTVPVMVLPDGQVLDESYQIMKAVLNHNDPAQLLHIDIKACDQMVAENDQQFVRHLNRYKYTEWHEGANKAEERAAAVSMLAQHNDRIAAQSYLLSDRLSLADIAVAPFIRQFANVDRKFFDGLAMQPLQFWLSTILESDYFQSVMHKYSQWHIEDNPSYFP